MTRSGAVWELPGPRRFVESIVSDLRDGSSVVIVAPPHCPPGLLAEVYARTDGAFSWMEHDLVDDPQADGTPEGVIATMVAPAFASIEAILRECEGFVFAVRGVDGEAWPEWRKYLDRFAHQARNSDSTDPPRLLLVADGTCAVKLHPEPAIKMRAWQGQADRLDCLIAASDAVAGRDLDPIERALIVSVAAEIAVFDPILAADLGRCSLEEITNVRSLMAIFREDCNDGEGELEATWAAGTADECEGETAISAGSLAVSADPRALSARIWRGQIAVLLPLVERERLKLFASVRPFVVLPYEAHDGKTLESDRDCQIGHIDELARKIGAGLDPGVRDYIGKLRQVRNALAHMDVVPAESVKKVLTLRAAAMLVLDGNQSPTRPLAAGRR